MVTLNTALDIFCNFELSLLHHTLQITTEHVRLTDERSLQKQTDEDGDLFNWMKHQAHQGVKGAQVTLFEIFLFYF